MSNLLKDIQCARSDTRPPMLDRTDFASWKQRIRLYCRGKKNGVNILKSIDEGPFQMGTFRETLVEDDEETIYNNYVRFSKLINDMRNIKMTMSKMQLNSKFVNNMLPEWGRFVTAVKLNRGLRDSNYDQLYAYLKQHGAHANENKMMLDRFTQHTVDRLALMSNVSHQQYYSQSSTTPPSTHVQPHLADNTHLDSGLSLTDNLIENLTNTLSLHTQSYKTYLPQTNNQLRTSSNTKNQATVQDGRVVVQNVQGRLNRGQGNNARGTDHIARNYTQPKRPQNSKYFKDKMLLMQAQENGVALDEEQLLFITGEQDNVDDDVDKQLVQDLALNVDNVFQADECDAFDSDVDEAPTAHTMFMANLSSVYPVYDKAGPSYDYDILSEVHDHDNYEDAVCELHGVHEIHDYVQLNYVVDSNAEYTSDSNMIFYDQFLKILSHSYLGIKPLPISLLGSGLMSLLCSGLPLSPSSGLTSPHENNVFDCTVGEKGMGLTYLSQLMRDHSRWEHLERHLLRMTKVPFIYVQNDPESILTYHRKRRRGGLRDSNYDQLYAYLKQHEAHANENKMMLDRFTQHTIDPLALMSNMSHQQYCLQSSTTPPSTHVQPHLADNTHLDSRLSPTDNLIENLTNTLSLHTQSYKTYLPQTNNQLRTSSNTRNQATVQDGRVVVKNVQGRLNRGQGNNARGTDHIARNCTQPKRPQNSEYFKDKMLLMQAQENGVALDEEQLLFITGEQDNVDDDVDEQLVQDLALNVDNMFQADKCDAFDSDVDEAPTAHTMFMANLSSVYPVYDEVGPSYDSDILSEVHNHDNYEDAVCELHGVHEIHDHVQLNCVVDSNTEYTSDSNMILYDQSKDLIKMKVEALKEQTSALRPIKELMVYPPNTPATLVLKKITPTGLTEEERSFEQTKTCYLTEVIPFFKTIKENFKGIQKALINEIKEMKEVFDQMEAEVDQHVIDKK
nr:hypothetical protein [Tanacetum cinerariifolium]